MSHSEVVGIIRLGIAASVPCREGNLLASEPLCESQLPLGKPNFSIAEIIFRGLETLSLNLSGTGLGCGDPLALHCQWKVA